jgi:hypothetical protein
MDSSVLSVVLLLLVTVAAGQAQSPEPYPFAQYPANEGFSGSPAPPRLATAAQREFRTVLREGAKKGPNFAGHYTVVVWGCGTSCAQVAIIDAITGRISDPPFKLITWDDGNGFLKQYGLHFTLSSSLFVAEGCPEEKNCAIRSYEWKGNKLVLLRTRPVERFPLVPAEPSRITVKP